MRSAQLKLSEARAVAAVCIAAACTSGTSPDQASSGLLEITPHNLVASATAGSTARQAMTFHVLNLGKGELQWSAMFAKGSAWLSMQPHSGKAGDSVLVWADPTGLAAGVYRDTVVVTSDVGIAKVAIELQADSLASSTSVPFGIGP